MNDVTAKSRTRKNIILGCKIYIKVRESKRMTRKTHERCSHIHNDIVKAMIINKSGVTIFFSLRSHTKGTGIYKNSLRNKKTKQTNK